jgi:hypothetical protein
MSRFYKPNNSTFLYLNSSSNCIKSNSITITKTGNGTGYTGTPTVIITPAAGDMGSGASATIAAPVSGALSGTLTMTNTGRGYNTLPTITLSGGGNPGTITALTFTNNGTGYILPPTLSATGGGGSGFAGTTTIGEVVISSTFTITSGGTGYAVGDIIRFNGGGGSNAAATVSTVNATTGEITAITLSNAGSGYSSVPYITITTDNGSGANISCSLVGAAITGYTITNGGNNYATTPTIVITVVNGGSGAVATPTLTLGTRATFTVAFTRTFSFSWNIPDIEINDLGKFSVVNLIATGYTATTPYTFRINNILYDSRNCYYSDYGSPIICMAQQTNMINYGSVSENKCSLTLSPQTIRQISINVDDSITAKDVGILAAINFVIEIEVDEFDPTLTQVGDPYQEAASKIKPF